MIHARVTGARAYMVALRFVNHRHLLDRCPCETFLDKSSTWPGEPQQPTNTRVSTGEHGAHEPER